MHLLKRAEEYRYDILRRLTDDRTFSDYAIIPETFEPIEPIPKIGALPESLGGVRFKIISSRPLFLEIHDNNCDLVSIFVLVRGDLHRTRAAVGYVPLKDLSWRLENLIAMVLSDGDEH